MRGWKSGEEIIFLNTYSLAEIFAEQMYYGKKQLYIFSNTYFLEY